jgi:Inner membrane protein YgaP-like, transmembrane domain
METAMETNVGAFDRSVRILIGLMFLSLFVLLKDNARWIGLIGLVPVVSGFVGWCPLYSVFGIRT